jgi:hypothetical protein
LRFTSSEIVYSHIMSSSRMDAAVAKEVKLLPCRFSGCAKAYKTESGLRRHFRAHTKTCAPPGTEMGWKRHFKYRHIYGLPDGRVWSCASGRYLTGTKRNGYIKVEVDGKNINRHRLNFEIATGRAIAPGMHIDHIVPSQKEANSSERQAEDDSWANLQEMTLAEHMRKTHAGNADRKQKDSCIPVLAAHVTDGETTRYNSMHDAAAALDLNVQAIKRRIRQRSSKAVGGYVLSICPAHLIDQDDREDEVWVDAIVDGTPLDGWKVSSVGRIQLQNGRRTEGYVSRERRKVIQVKKRGLIGVHAIVAHSFLGPPPTSKHTVDHIRKRR